MSLVLDALRALGVEGGLFIGAVLLLVAVYLYKGLKLGKRFGALVGSAVAYVAVVAVVIGIVVAIGWVDPNVGRVVTDVSRAIGTAADWAAGVPGRILQGVLG